MGLKEQIAIAKEQMQGFEIPSLPKEVIELQTLLKKTDFPDMGEVATIIKQNTVLSGEIIKVANQRQFKPQDAEDVETVKVAIGSLGLERLKKLIFGMAFKTQVKDEVFEDLMMHSVGVANVAAELSKYIEGVDSEDAYLAGLFHNAGAIIMTMRFADYNRIFYKSISHCYSEINRESSQYFTNHGIYGLLVARVWGLAPRYSQVILLHHQRDLSIVKDDSIRTLVLLVQLAITIVSEALFNSYLGDEVLQMKNYTIEELMIEVDVVDDIRRAVMTGNLV